MMRPRQPIDPDSLRGTTDEEILRNFVASVRRSRGGSGTAPRFRRDDLVVLVGLLGTDAERIERRLVALTGCSRSTAKRLRRVLLVTLAALPIAPAMLAVSWPTATASATAPAAKAVIAGSAVPTAPPTPTLDDTQGTPVTVAEPTVESPVAPAPAPMPARVPQGAEATVVISRVGIDLAVFGGGQDVIDHGLVAHYWAPGWREPAAAGAAGTYWLAAHHETHGSPFLRLPEVVVGDQVVVTTATRTFTYTVSSTEVVDPSAGFGPVYGSDRTAPVILLQTCLDDVRRLLVHGTLTAAT